VSSKSVRFELGKRRLVATHLGLERAQRKDRELRMARDQPANHAPRERSVPGFILGDLVEYARHERIRGVRCCFAGFQRCDRLTDTALEDGRCECRRRIEIVRGAANIDGSGSTWFIGVATTRLALS